MQFHHLYKSTLTISLMRCQPGTWTKNKCCVQVKSCNNWICPFTAWTSGEYWTWLLISRDKFCLVLVVNLLSYVGLSTKFQSSGQSMLICLCCLFISYVVTLVADGVRSVRNFNFDKAAASVLTSCVSFQSNSINSSRHHFCFFK